MADVKELEFVVFFKQNDILKNQCRMNSILWWWHFCKFSYCWWMVREICYPQIEFQWNCIRAKKIYFCFFSTLIFLVGDVKISNIIKFNPCILSLCHWTLKNEFQKCTNLFIQTKTQKFYNNLRYNEFKQFKQFDAANKLEDKFFLRQIKNLRISIYYKAKRKAK